MAAASQETRPRIAVADLEDFIRRAFEAAEYSPEDAKTVSRVLTTADMNAIESHGAPLAHGYINRTRQGLINPRPNIRVISEYPGTLVLDADDGLGPVIGDYAMRRAVEKAAVNGVATVTVRNSNHYASCFYYPLIAIEAGMAGMTMTTSGPLVLPTFGAAPVLGTNPIGLGFPGGDNEPAFVLDMATSIVALGKVRVYGRDGKTLPEGWAYDENMHPTTDPNKTMWLTTLGIDRDHSSQKGYGLNVAGDLFCGLLSGGRYSAQQSVRAEGFERTSHMFTAWRIDAFVGMEEYRARFDEYIGMLHACPPMDPKQPVMVPGEPEYRAERERRANGIPLHPIIYNDLAQLAKELEIPFV